MPVEDYRQLYERDYLSKMFTHTYEQDRAVARLRFDRYRLPAGCRILDVGAANGAFVDEGFKRGYDIWGQDLAHDANADRVYVGALADIRFPTASFDAVTIHDVLEHVVDPRALLAEIRRILKPRGWLIVDFPRFDVPEGRHHWRPVQHLWLLDTDQLAKLISAAGFSVETIENPIPSKVVVRAKQRPVPTSARILVPSGIGDAYWVLVKLRGFLEARGIVLPEIYIRKSGEERSADFWRRVPFVRYAEPAYIPRTPENLKITHRAFKEAGFSVQEDVWGFDYFLSANGDLLQGRSMDATISDRSNWQEPIFWSKADLAQVQEYRAKLGEYVVAAFWSHNFYKEWLEVLAPDQIEAGLKLLARRYRVVVSGAEWDQTNLSGRLGAAQGLVNMVGQTTFGQLLALIRGAAGVIGFPAGTTLMAPYLGTPTTILWHDFFRRAMWQNCVAPHPDYRALDIRQVDARRLGVLTFGEPERRVA